jgi:acyl carrier protein
MTKIQKDAKRAEWSQKIISVAMSESGKNGLLPATKVANVFDSLEYLEFLMKLSREFGEVDKDRAANAETFQDLAEQYASSN